MNASSSWGLPFHPKYFYTLIDPSPRQLEGCPIVCLKLTEINIFSLFIYVAE